MNGTQKAVYGAVVAALIAGVTAAVQATDDASITMNEWLQIVLAVLVSLGAVGGTVYGVKNKVDGEPVIQDVARRGGFEEPEDEHS